MFSHIFGSFKRLVTVLAALVGLMGVMAVPAWASPDPYPWPHNGCTNAPDKPSGFDFTYACNHHDGCYARHWADRSTCDAWFRNDMMEQCRHYPFDLIANCTVTGLIYYGAVRMFGQKYYDSNGELVRISTPVRVG